MRDRLLLLVWAAAVAALSSVHDLRILAAALPCAALAAGRGAPRAARRAALAVAIFGGTVGVTWLAVALVRGEPTPGAALAAVARLELRAFLITFLTFGVLPRLDADRLLAGRPALRAGLRVALAQAALFRRILGEYLVAFESRRLGPARWTDRLRHAAACSGGLVSRALHESEEVAHAMEARGLLPPVRPDTGPGRAS